MKLLRLQVAILLIMAAGCSFEIEEAMERDSEYQAASPPGSWVPRDGQRPLDSDEQLAVQLVRSGDKKLEQQARTATMLQESTPTYIVLVETLPSRNEPLTKLVMYHLEGETVVSVTTPQYVDRKKEEDMERRRQAAREVAIQARDRKLPLLPVLWWGKYVYTPSSPDGCDYTVVEHDSNREETGSFEVNLCKEETKR